MAPVHFTVGSRAEAELFAVRTQEYQIAWRGHAVQHLPLANAYVYCISRSDGSQLFASLFDIYINNVLLYRDMLDGLGLWNGHFSNGRNSHVATLESTEMFIVKMDIHRHVSSFVFRYRAMWDKLMGAWLLLYLPEEYPAFSGARSKRRSFLKSVMKIVSFPPDTIKAIRETLEAFDGEFRTPEVHGTGSLRKLSFASGASLNILPGKLVPYYNKLNDVLALFGACFHVGGEFYRGDGLATEGEVADPT